MTGSSLYSPHYPTRNTEQHYTLDKEGNRVGSGAHADPTACHSNRLEQLGHTQFRYDDAGNLIERRTPQDLQTLQYDGLHRLSCVKRQRPGYPTTEIYYIYDALSRRICKQVIPERSQSHSIRYGWDGDQLVHEDAGDQRTTVFYEPGSFVPLFRVDETKRTEQMDDQWLLRDPQDPSDKLAYDTHYSAFVTDHLGTPMKLIGSDGHLLWTGKPDDWAAIRDEKAVPDLKQPIRFQGQWLDEETGLYYNRYRYYDPKQGRYITQDPIGLAGGMNSYAYVGNPTGWVDPLGLSAASVLSRAKTILKVMTNGSIEAADIRKQVACNDIVEAIHEQIPEILQHYEDMAKKSRDADIEGCKSDRRNRAAFSYSPEDNERKYYQCEVDAKTAHSKMMDRYNQQIDEMIKQRQSDYDRLGCIYEKPQTRLKIKHRL